METVEFRSRSRFAFPTGWGTPAIDIAMRRDPDPVESDFPATLLAMAGHDLRQPLSAMESLAYCLELTIPPEHEQARRYITRLQQLVEEASSTIATAVSDSRRPL